MRFCIKTLAAFFLLVVCCSFTVGCIETEERRISHQVRIVETPGYKNRKVEEFEWALDQVHKNPSDPMLRCFLGNIYLYDKKNFSAAHEQFLKFRELCPDSPRAHFKVAEALVFMGEKSRAFSAFKKCVAVDPAYRPAYYSLYRLSIEMKMYEQAEVYRKKYEELKTSE